MSTQIGSLFLELRLDTQSYMAALENARVAAQNTGRQIESSLDFKKPNIHLKATVDDRALTNLNKHLDLKDAHVKQIQRSWNANPLTPRVDLKEIRQATHEIKEFKRLTESIKPTSGTGTAKQKIEVEIDTDAIAKAVEKGMSGGSGLDKAIGNLFSAPFRLAAESGKRVFIGMFEGIGSELTKEFASGLGVSLQAALGSTLGSSELVGEKLGESIIQAMRKQLKDLPEAFKKDLKEAISDSAKEALGEDAISKAFLVKQSEAARKSDRETRAAREQANVNRRDALREQIGARSDFTNNEAAIANVKGAIVRGNQVAERIEAQKFMAQLSGNSSLVQELNESLAENARILSSLAGEEAALMEAQAKLYRNADNARKKVESSKKAIERLQPEAVPTAYLEALEQATGGNLPKQSMIPKLVVADAALQKAGANAQYGIQSNTIQVTSELKKAIDDGTLSAKQLYTLYEEVEHAIDYGFGSLKGSQAARSGKILRPMTNYSDSEFSAIAKELEAYDPKERASELNAKIRARRQTAKAVESRLQSEGVGKLEQWFGVGGQKYEDYLGVKLSPLRSKASTIQNIAQSKNMGMGESVDRFIDAIDLLEQSVGNVQTKLQSARKLSSTEVSELRNTILSQLADIQKLSDQFPQIKNDFLAHVEETEKLRKQAARQEKIQQVAETAGGVARGAVNVAGAISRGVGGVAHSAMSSAPMQALGAGAKMGYSMLQGAESLALDMLPFGRTMKGVGQQVVIPAAMFGAAQHFLPGGGAIAQGVSNAAQSALAPVAHGASSALSSGIADLVANAIPNKFGLSGLETQIISTLTGSIETLVSGVSGVISEVGTAVLGGKLIQNAAMKPVKAILPASPPIQASLQLPFAPKPTVAALPPVPITGGLSITNVSAIQQQISHVADLTQNQEKIETAMNAVAFETGRVARGAVDNVTQIAEKIKNLSPEQALARAQDISGKFREAFARLKDVQKQGNEELAGHIADSIRAMAESAKQEIGTITASLGDQAKMGTKLGSQLAQTKGQISQAYNKTNRYENLKSAATPDPWGDEGEDVRKQLNLERLRGKTPLNQVLTEAENASDRFDSAFKRINQAIDQTFAQTSQAVNTASDALENGGQIAQKTEKSFLSLAEMVDAGLGAFLGLQAIAFVAPLFLGVADASSKAALEFEAMERSIGGGNLEKGALALAKINEQSNQLGLNAKIAAQGYAQLSAATRDTSLEGSTDQIFSSIQSAASAYTLSPQRQELVNTAIAQISSKGVVSMEELRQQLGESLPGAMAIAARSMNMTTAQFNKFVESGQLLSEEFLPKFAQQLNAEVAVAAESASNSAQGSFNRLQNRITELQVSFGKELLPVQSVGAEAIATILTAISNNASTVLNVFTALSLLITGAIVKGLYQMATQLGLIPSLATLSSESFQMMGSAIAGAVAKLALLTAALQLAGQLAENFQDKSIGSLKEIADTTQKTATQLSRTLNTSPDNRRKSVDEELGIQRIGPITVDREWHKNIPGISQIGSVFFGQKDTTQRILDFKKQQQDTDRSLFDLTSGTNTSIAQSKNIRSAPELSQLRQIDSQLEQMRLQQRMTRMNDPNNVGAIAQLRQQESVLMKQRETIATRTGAVQGALAQNIQGLKQAISELESKPEYVGEVAKLKTLLQEAEQAQSDFNLSVDSGAARLERFNRSWANITANLADAKTQIELASVANLESILSAESSGAITTGQSQSMQQLENQRKLGEVIAKNRSAIAQLNTELSTPETAQSLATMGVTSQTGQAQLKALSERINTPKEQALLEKVSQLRELEAETARSQGELVAAQNEASKQIRESTKAVDEYMRTIARQVEDINASVKAQSLEIKSINLRSRIDEALTGVRKTFVSDLTTAIVDLLDVTNQKGKNVLTALTVQSNALRRSQDAQLQGQELIRGLPSGMIPGMNVIGGSTTRFSGIQVTSAVDASGEPGLDYVVANGKRGAQFGSLTDGKVVKTVTNQNWESNLEKGDTRRGYGNQVIVRTVDRITGEVVDLLYAHLDKVLVKEGDRIGVGTVLGTQGRTGSTTGAHVSVDFFKKNANYAGSAQLNMRDRLARELAQGAPSLNKSIQQPANNIAPINRGSRIGGVGGFDATKINQSVAILQQQGLSPLASAYLTGSFMQESGLNPQADNGTHRGIMGWDKQHRSRGMPSDFAGQVKFAVEEGLRDSPQHIATLRSRNATPQQIEAAIRGLTRWGNGEEKARFQYGREIFEQMQRGGGARMNPTTSMSSAQIQQAELSATLNAQAQQQIGASLSGLDQAGQLETQSALAFANAQNRQLDASVKRQITEAGMTAIRNAEEESKTARSQLESIQDQMRSLGFETPERSYQFKAIDISRSARDQSEQIQLKISDMENALKELGVQEKQITEAVKSGTLDRTAATPVLNDIKKVRGFTQKTIAQYRDAEKAIKTVEKAQIEDAQLKQALSIAQREAQFRSKLATQTVERLQFDAERMKNSGNPLDFIRYQEESQTTELRNTIAEETASIEDFARQQGLAKDQTQLLLNGLKELENLRLDKIVKEAEKLKKELAIANQETIFDSINKTADAEMEGFRIVGMERFAKDIEREKALAQERFSLASEMKRINELISSGSIDRQSGQQAIANVDRAFNKRIDNIKRQYSVLNEIIANNKGAFQDFFSGLMTGTEDFGSAFSKLIQSISSNLASMASQLLTEEIMGIFTGKNRASNQADAEKLYSTIAPATTYDSQGRELIVAANDAGLNFKGLTEQAGQLIIEAGARFADAIAQSQIGYEKDSLSDVIDRKFGLESLDSLPSSPRSFLTAKDFRFGNAKISEFIGDVPDIDLMRYAKILSSSTISSIGRDSSDLFTSAEKASFTIQDGVRIASEFLADSGLDASDNLLGSLSKGLPGILNSLIGAVSGGKGGGVGGILGSLISPILGGLFGGGGGLTGLDIDLATPVLNFKEGGAISSDGRRTIDGKFFKGSNAIAQAVRREGRGAIVSVLNDREYVLNESQAAIYFGLGLNKLVEENDKIPNFRLGGSVGVGAAARFTKAQDLSITVPVTVSDGSSVDPQRLAESIRGAVQNEIAKQQRPGGQLY